jgi:hypothetical protein
VEVQLHGFLTSALDGGEWRASRRGRFTPRVRAPGTHRIGGWVGPRAVLDATVKRKIPSLPPGIEPHNPDRPAHSPALYRLSYHGCYINLISFYNFYVRSFVCMSCFIIQATCPANYNCLHLITFISAVFSLPSSCVFKPSRALCLSTLRLHRYQHIKVKAKGKHKSAPVPKHHIANE